MTYDEFRLACEFTIAALDGQRSAIDLLLPHALGRARTWLQKAKEDIDQACDEVEAAIMHQKASLE